MRNLFKNALPFLVLIGILSFILATKNQPSRTTIIKQQCSGKCPSNNTNNGGEHLSNNPFKRLIVSL